MPLLTFPRLPLNPAPETIAFRAVDAVLRADPDLKRVVKTIMSWQGDALDDARPTLNLVPWLRITPVAGPAAWETEGQHRMPMAVEFELAVQGTCSDQIMNLWSAVRSALFPTDPTKRAAVRAAMNGASITRGEFTACAYGIHKDEDNAKMLLASGSLNLLLLINT